jgi:hypothetical protein
MAPGAKQQTSLPSQVWFVGRTDTRSRPVGSSRWRSISLAGILDTLSPAIGFSSSMRLSESRPPTNCTWVSVRYRKGSEDYTPVCDVCRLRAAFPNAGRCSRRLGGSDDVMSKKEFRSANHHHAPRWGWNKIADLPPKSNPVHRKPGTLCE